MKKLLFILTMLVVSLTTFSQSNADYYKNLYRSYGWNIGLQDYATLSEGESAYAYVNFTSGYEYRIIAFSNDNSVSDVDLFIYLSDGSLFVKDADSSRLAIVSFDCTYSQQVKVVIKNYASYSRYSSIIRYFVAYK